MPQLVACSTLAYYIPDPLPAGLCLQEPHPFDAPSGMEDWGGREGDSGGKFQRICLVILWQSFGSLAPTFLVQRLIAERRLRWGGSAGVEALSRAGLL